MPGGVSVRDQDGAEPAHRRTTGAMALIALVLVAAIATTLAATTVARAMTFTVAGPPAGPAGFTHEVRATGSFERGDTDQLAAVLQGLRGGTAARPVNRAPW